MIAVPETFLRRAAVVGAVIDVESVAESSTATSTLTEKRQPRAKADGEPFAEVERLEEHCLHALQRRADRLCDADFPVRIGDGADGHKVAGSYCEIPARHNWKCGSGRESAHHYYGGRSLSRLTPAAAFRNPDCPFGNGGAIGKVAVGSIPRFSVQRQFLERLFKKLRQNFDDQFMIGALRQAGNRDRADATRAVQLDRKAPAVRRIVTRIHADGFGEGFLLPAQLQANRIRTAVKTQRHVAFAADPIRVVRRGARHGGEKQRVPVHLDFNRDGQAARLGNGPQARSQRPGGVGSKLRNRSRSSCRPMRSISCSMVI